MICFLVRDLFFLYFEDDCKSEMEYVIEEYLKICSSCREMYDMMFEFFLLEGGQVVEEVFLLEEEMWFKQRYYGLLIVKVVCWFGVVVVVMLIIKLLI